MPGAAGLALVRLSWHCRACLVRLPLSQLAAACCLARFGQLRTHCVRGLVASLARRIIRRARAYVAPLPSRAVLHGADVLRSQLPSPGMHNVQALKSESFDATARAIRVCSEITYPFGA